MSLPLIAMGIAAGAGIASNVANYFSAKDAKKAAMENEEKTRQWAQGLKDSVRQHYDQSRGLYGTEQDVQDYLDKVRGYDQEKLYNEFYDLDGDGVADTEKFEFGGSVDDYYNKNSEKIIGDVMRKAQGVAAGQGMGRSYDALQGMLQAGIDKDEQMWQDANSNYNQARNQAYSEWNSYLNQKNNQYNAIVQAMQGDLSASQGLAQMFQTNAQNEFEDLMNAEIAGQNAVQGAANTTANTGNYTFDLGSILSGAGQLANGVSRGLNI